jgi:hypothetical protein
MSKSKYTITIFRQNGRWHWHAKTRVGKVIAQCSKGFVTEHQVRSSLAAFMLAICSDEVGIRE